uniref:Apoptogenic protein 1, mitochondrial n=1 Tax=Homalodisca liturata TaxID=320908 RepID=A0A1B6JBG9_9HEMI
MNNLSPVLNNMSRYFLKCQIPVQSTKFGPQISLGCHTNAQSSPPSSARDHHCDLIGPPHPVSNLRPFHFYIPDNESPIETQFRLKRQEVQQWNQEFWTEQNIKFVNERKEFMATHQKDGDSPLSADEMSVFYKAFLDKNWKTHLEYNLDWYRRNAQLILLHLRVKVAQLLRPHRAVREAQK